MQDHHGIFIVLEGSDGSGKGTQFRILSERLKAVGHEVAIFDFPRYNEPSSHFVKHYLNGDYGPASEISPYTASFFYALDRYEASPQIKKSLDVGKVVLANRYVGSNMAHQGTKFDTLSEQRGFFMWADNLEYQLLGIPRPSINLVLKVPAEVSFELIARKSDRSYTSKKRDEHEADIEHIKKAVAAYDLLCKLFPRDFKEIDCTRNGQILTIVQISDKIWESLKPLLPLPRRRGKGIVLRLDQPINSGSSKSTSNLPKADSKSAAEIKPSKKTSDFKFEQILKLQKKMLTRVDSLQGIDQGQLKAAINLATPLFYRKDKIQDLVKQSGASIATKGDEPVSLNKIIDEMSGSMSALSNDEDLKLLQASPRNEFQILNQASTLGLNYQQKQRLLQNQLKNAASKFIYNFEAVSNFDLLLAFKTGANFKKVELLSANSTLAYKTPDIIEAAGLEESFNRAFDISSALYRKAASSKSTEAIYSLLLGHNVRWKFEIDAATLSKVLKTSEKSELVTFTGLLLDKISEVHPHVAKALPNKTLANP